MYIFYEEQTCTIEKSKLSLVPVLVLVVVVVVKKVSSALFGVEKDRSY